MLRARTPRRIAALALAVGLASGAHAQTLSDPSLIAEEYVAGLGTLAAPTAMAFVAPDDILVLNKQGFVKRVLNGVIQPGTVLTVVADNDGERGLLGIAVDHASPPHVFLSYTEKSAPNGLTLANRVYRYDWDPIAGKLTSPVFVLEWPVTPDTGHNGGALLLGPEGEGDVGDGSLLYVAVGDLQLRGELQNIAGGIPPNDTSVILRVQQDGTPAPGNPFTPYCSVTTTLTCNDDDDCPSDQVCRTAVARYYAYGVRNSFGLGLDPETGRLWETENGEFNYDEVNLVMPGMNSGWVQLMGPDARDPQGVADLFNMPGSGVTYSDPEFSWVSTICPTGIVLPKHTTLGPAYDHTVLVGDCNFGRIHALPLNASRTGLNLTGLPGLADRVADNMAQVNLLVLGTDFGAITDLEIGPDRNLYVLSLFPPSIYRVSGPAQIPALPESAAVALTATMLVGAWWIQRARRPDAENR